MPDLHGWIAQQIDKAERGARHNPKCLGRPVQIWSPPFFGECGCDGDRAVLRRCEADRRILARHRLNPDAYWANAAMCEGCGTEGEMGYAVTENLNDCPELLDLAEAHGLTPEILAGLDRPQEGERPDYPGETGNVVHDSIASLYGTLYKQVMETTFASISATESLLVTGDPTVEPRAKVIGAAPSDWPTQYSHLSVPEWLHVDLAPEPTPAERAFAVVEPHLSALALYKPDINPET